MGVSIEKIDGVESANVSLNQGLVHVRLRPGNTVRIERVREAITNNGFTPKQAKIAAVGKIISDAGKLKFQIAGTGQIFDLNVDPANKELSEAARKDAGKTVNAEGVITFSKNKIPDTVVLTAINDSGKS